MNYTQARYYFYFALAFSLPIKLYLAHTLPLTGDEAYFVLWAQNPALGYYDHPPLVGWLIHLSLKIHESELFVRLPSILGGYVLVWGIYYTLRDQDRTRAILVSTIFLLTPVYLLGVMVSTDTPLIVAMFLSAMVLYRAEQKDSSGLYLVSGILLGLAFLSKYFAALLLLAYLIHFLSLGFKRLDRLALVLLGCMPLILLNLYWNYTHCWANIMFNFINRTQDPQVSLVQPLALLAVLVWIISPVLAVQFLRNLKNIISIIKAKGFGLFFLTALVPLGVFFAVSWFYSVGLHWVLGFIPFLYLIYAHIPGKSLVFARKFMLGYALVHAIIVVILLSLPLDVIRNSPSLHQNAIFYLRPAELAEAVNALDADHYTTSSYSRSAVLSFYSRHYWGVLGTGSKYGREDDRLTDFRKLDGKDILFLSRRPALDTDMLEPFFSSVEIHLIELKGTEFAVGIGREFNFLNYQVEVLADIKKRYYDIPDLLPQGACYFIDRYFQ